MSAPNTYIGRDRRTVRTSEDEPRASSEVRTPEGEVEHAPSQPVEPLFSEDSGDSRPVSRSGARPPPPSEDEEHSGTSHQGSVDVGEPGALADATGTLQTGRGLGEGRSFSRITVRRNTVTVPTVERPVAHESHYFTPNEGPPSGSLREDASEDEQGDNPQPKGKGVDPANWGGLELTEFEKDPVLQGIAWESLRYHNHGPSGAVANSPLGNGKSNVIQATGAGPVHQPAPLKPDAQIPKSSYLGSALAYAERAASQIPEVSGMKTRDSSQGIRSNLGAASAAGAQGIGSIPLPGGNLGVPVASNPSVNPPVQWVQVPVAEQAPSGGFNYFKLIKPSSYDGRVNSRAFFRFARESSAFVEHGKIPANQVMLVLSHFLKGKAYDFYTQKVAMNEDQWTLPQFFRGLYRYCFPLNYLSKLRTKMEQCHQGNRSVSAFAHELHEFFINLGDVSEKEKARRLFRGLRPSIQEVLYRDGYNEEFSSWDAILDKAERVEMAENVVKHGQFQLGQRPKGNGNNHSGQVRNHGDRSGRFGTSSGKQDSRVQSPDKNSGSRSSEKGSTSAGGSSQSSGRFSSPKNGSSSSKQGKPLSNKEKKELIAEDRCFRCKAKGHLSRNCPEGNKVSGGSKRPPGVSNFNIGANGLEDDDRAPSMDVLESFPLGSLSWDLEDEDDGFSPLYFEPSDDENGNLEQERVQASMLAARSFQGRLWGPPKPFLQHNPEDPWSVEAPRWLWIEHSSFPRACIGDAFAMVIAFELNEAQPYPFDDRFVEKVWLNKEGTRFSVTAHSRRKKGYQIVDRMTNFVVNIPRRYIENEKFDITTWYALKRSKAFGGSRPRHWLRGMTIGDPLEMVTEPYLTECIHTHLPMVSDRVEFEARFQVVRKSKHEDVYLIRDGDLQLELEISGRALRDSGFRLGDWYSSHPTVEQAYRQEYCALLGIPEVGTRNSCVQDAHRGVPLVPLDPHRCKRDGDLIRVRWGDFLDGRDAGIISKALEDALMSAGEYPIEDLVQTYPGKWKYRFETRIEYQSLGDDWLGLEPSYLVVYDWKLKIESGISLLRVRDPNFCPALWWAAQSARKLGHDDPYGLAQAWMQEKGADFALGSTLSHHLSNTIKSMLLQACPFEMDPVRPRRGCGDKGRFDVCHLAYPSPHYRIWDSHHCLESWVTMEELESPHFHLTGRYELLLADHHFDSSPSSGDSIEDGMVPGPASFLLPVDDEDDLMIFAVRSSKLKKCKQVDADKYPAVERNAAVVRNGPRVIPKPIVVDVKINGKPCRALIDSGSFGDFISTTSADQLKLKLTELPNELNLHMAVQGSRSKIKFESAVRFQYQSIDETRDFYIANLNTSAKSVRRT